MPTALGPLNGHRFLVHAAACAFLCALGVAAPAFAQGVTGAVLLGRVTSADGEPVANARVQLVGTTNGERWQTATRADGRYLFEQVSVGGPYRLEVRSLGHAPVDHPGVFLELGERRTVHIVLNATTAILARVTILGAGDPRIGADRTGPAQTIAETTLVRLPIFQRDVTLAALLSPQVVKSPTGGLSFAGQSSQLNGLQIDGTNNVDQLGSGLVGLNGIPGIGSGFGAPTLASEAVKAIQIVSAPYDVRFGNFAGGLINAVTRSGTDQLRGSAFAYLEGHNLAGPADDLSRDFSKQEQGFTLGGPIVRGRSYFFVTGTIARTILPQETVRIGSDTAGGADSAGIGIRYASLVRFQDIMRNVYGLDAGDNRLRSYRVGGDNFLAKLTFPLGVNQRLELSHSYVVARFRMDGGFHGAYSNYQLSSFGYEAPQYSQISRLTYSAKLGSRLSNETVVSRLSEGISCRSANYAHLNVAVDRARLGAGPSPGFEFGCDGGDSLLELTDNLGIDLGNHHLTVGTHDELSHVVSRGGGFFTNWSFNSLDSLTKRLPAQYAATLQNPAHPGGSGGDFRVNTLGFYLQDQWSVTSRLQVTIGLRRDVPLLPSTPATNPALLTELGINTASSPTGNATWSPRIGVNYDVSGDASTFVRGGVGLFSGRPPGKWLLEPYTHTGLDQITLSCAGPRVPVFTIEIARQPYTCLDGNPGVNSGTLVSIFRPGFRFPQNLKASLGVDRRFADGWIASADLLVTRGVNQYYLTDANLAEPSRVESGEGGRVLYGTITPANGRAVPSRLSTKFGQIVAASNSSGDQSLSASVEVQKRFTRGAELRLSYAYTRARDRMSAPGNGIFNNLAQSALDGTLANRNLSTSEYEVPHKLSAFFGVNIRGGVRATLLYQGYSGGPFSYTIDGDANADGVGSPGNSYTHDDLVYVPARQSDITLDDPTTWPTLDGIIQGASCLRSQRGAILRRNSCRNPWINATTLRLTKVVTAGGGHTLEITGDLFNLLHLLNSNWGTVRQTAGYQWGSADLLRIVGFDAVNNRGIYHVSDAPVSALDLSASRWSLQLSARYTY